MIKVFGSTGELESSRIDRKMVELYDHAKEGNDLAVTQIIEPIGNDDRATTALINLLDVASIDSPGCMAQGVLKAEALAELVSAFDDYHREVFGQ